MALPKIPDSLKNLGVELYYNGKSWQPQYTGENNAPLTQSSWINQYAANTPSYAGYTPAQSTSPSGQTLGATAPPVNNNPSPWQNPAMGQEWNGLVWNGSSWGAKESGGGDYGQLAQNAAQPLFDELDRQAGLLGEQQAGMEQQVSNLYGTQKTTAEAGKTSALGSLALAEQGEMKNSANSLRDLSENVRNVLSAASNIWGNSSAVQAATGGIAKFAGKQRGNIMENRSTALSQIAQKKSDVESTFGKQMSEIETWKSNQMITIADEIRKQDTQIKSQRAELQGNLRADILSKAWSQIQALNQRAQSWADSLQTWALQRQASLDDYGQKLQVQSAYNRNPNNYVYSTPGTGMVNGTQNNAAYQQNWGAYMKPKTKDEELAEQAWASIANLGK